MSRIRMGSPTVDEPGRHRPGTGAGARRERWRDHREARREQLVDAAIEAIRRRGAGLAMDDIAASAKVSKPILYRHFTDRADLWLAVGRRVTDELLETMSKELVADRPPRETIASVIDTYLGVIERDPELYRFIVHGSFVDPGTSSALVQGHMALMAAAVARVLGDGLREAGVDFGGAEAWAHGIVGMVQAAADWWIGRRSLSRAALVEYLTRLISSGIEGLFSEASTGAAALRILERS